MLTIGNLEASQHGRTDSEEGTVLAAEMARWCEGIDEFGTLVWMASLLE